MSEKLDLGALERHAHNITTSPKWYQDAMPSSYIKSQHDVIALIARIRELESASQPIDKAHVRLEIEHVLHTLDGGFAMDMGGDRIIETVMRLIRSASQPGGGEALAWIPEEAIAMLKPPLLLLTGVTLYRYDAVGTRALYLRAAPSTGNGGAEGGHE